MIIKVNFPIPPSLNKQIDLARGSKAKSAAIKAKLTASIKNFCRQIPHKFNTPVYVVCVWKIKILNHDPVDNLPASFKYIGDGLTASKVIIDDSVQWINSPVIHAYEKGDNTVDVYLSDKPLYRLEPLQEGLPCL